MKSKSMLFSSWLLQSPDLRFQQVAWISPQVAWLALKFLDQGPYKSPAFGVSRVFFQVLNPYYTRGPLLRP